MHSSCECSLQFEMFLTYVNIPHSFNVHYRCECSLLQIEYSPKMLNVSYRCECFRQMWMFPTVHIWMLPTNVNVLNNYVNVPNTCICKCFLQQWMFPTDLCKCSHKCECSLYMYMWMLPQLWMILADVKVSTDVNVVYRWEDSNQMWMFPTVVNFISVKVTQ